MGPFCIFAEIRSNSSIKNKLKQLMSNSKISAAAFADTKPHYDLLDGLRGVAALMVIFYRGLKPLMSPINYQFNHGLFSCYFFYPVRSGDCLCAYDDRWKTTTIKTLSNASIDLVCIRWLSWFSPLGVIALRGCDRATIMQVSISMVMLALLINLFLIPAVPPGLRSAGMERCILNGPSWSFVLLYISKYYVCVVYSSDVNEGAYGACRLGGNRIGFVRYIQFFRCGAPRCGVDDGRVQFDRWLTSAIFFLDGIVDVARF